MWRAPPAMYTTCPPLPSAKGGAHGEAVEPTHTMRDGRRAGAGPGRSRPCAGSSGRSDDVGAALLAGADVVRAGGDAGRGLAVHDPVRAARRAGEADAGQGYGAEPRRV